MVDPARQAHLDRVFFGATVTYANAAGDERTITIVGVDEVDADNGRVSWISPIARALMKAQEGECRTRRREPRSDQVRRVIVGRMSAASRRILGERGVVFCGGESSSLGSSEANTHRGRT